MNHESVSPINIERVKSRPFGLTIILILSFIGCCIGLLLAIASIFGGQIETFFNNLPVMDAILRDDSLGNKFYIALKLVFYCASFMGVFFMWKLRKKGFWIYLVTQISLLAIPFLFLAELGTSYLLVRLLINTVFLLLFIMLYSFYVKLMD